MTYGTRHTLTGILTWDDRLKMHLLVIAGGHRWRVDLRHINPDPGLIGHVVIADGIRTGMSVIEVQKIRKIHPHEWLRPDNALPQNPKKQ